MTSMTMVAGETGDEACPVCGATMREGVCITQIAGSGAWSVFWHGTVEGFFDRAAAVAREDATGAATVSPLPPTHRERNTIMQFIAFTPAAALRFAALATAQQLTEDETCAVLRVLHTAHAHGIVPVASVERAVTDVTIASTLAALNARARVPSGQDNAAPVVVAAD